MLEKVTKAGVTEYRHLLHGGSGLAAIHARRTSGTPLTETFYVHGDQLGSSELITKENGTVLARLSFAAYGERRDKDWEGPVSPADMTAIESATRHGFTGHEHLDSVGLIHMNGRVYDPIVGRFLGVDPIVSGGNSQDVNSYAYAWNNPLSYTDPSGLTEVNGSGVIQPGDLHGSSEDTWDLRNRPRTRPGPRSPTWNGGMDQSCRPGDVPGPVTGTARAVEYSYWRDHPVGAFFGRLGGNPIAIFRDDKCNPITGECLSPGEVADEKILLLVSLPVPGGRVIATSARETATAARHLGRLEISAARYPDLAENILQAQRAGHPSVLTHGGNAASNRAAALDGIPNIKGLSRDEYPFASTMEGGGGSWVGHIPASQQQAQRGLITDLVRKFGIKVGDQYEVVVVR